MKLVKSPRNPKVDAVDWVERIPINVCNSHNSDVKADIARGLGRAKTQREQAQQIFDNVFLLDINANHRIIVVGREHSNTAQHDELLNGRAREKSHVENAHRKR